MNDEYVVWLLIVALCGVGALLWFLYGRVPRSEDDVSTEELMAESAWISDALAEDGRRVDPIAVEHVLRLHRRYLAGVVPPREPTDPGWPLPDDEDTAATAATADAAGAPPNHEAAMEREPARRESHEADIRPAS